MSTVIHTEKAPAAVVETERAKLDKYTGILKNVEEMLAQL